jgi:hypothetical protein
MLDPMEIPNSKDLYLYLISDPEDDVDMFSETSVGICRTTWRRRFPVTNINNGDSTASVVTPLPAG